MGMNNGAQDAADEQEGAAQRAGERYANEAGKAVDYAKERYAEGRGDIEGYYDKGQSYLDPYRGAGKTGLDAYLAGMGLGDKDSADKLYEQFRQSPGYQGALKEGQQAVERSAAAGGRTQSGALLKQLTRYGQDYADQQYSKFQDRLGTLAGMGQQAASQSSANAVNTGGALAGVGQNYAKIVGDYYTGIGQNYADSEIAQGNARAQGAMNKSSPWAGIGTIVGGATGAYFGGPAGASAGASAGGRAGKYIGGG